MGSGDGVVTKFDIYEQKPIKSVEFQGSISSIANSKDNIQSFVSTSECNI